VAERAADDIAAAAAAAESRRFGEIARRAAERRALTMAARLRTSAARATGLPIPFHRYIVSLTLVVAIVTEIIREAVERVVRTQEDPRVAGAGHGASPVSGRRKPARTLVSVSGGGRREGGAFTGIREALAKGAARRVSLFTFRLLRCRSPPSLSLSPSLPPSPPSLSLSFSFSLCSNAGSERIANPDRESFPSRSRARSPSRGNRIIARTPA